jgi:NDP-sugar pyrophosphorylase family protein
VVICVGYLGERIEETIGSEQFGVHISYSYDSPGLDGTLGAIRRAAPLLGDRFLTLYGDTYLRVDYQAFEASWRSSGLPAAMAVLQNRDQWERSNAVFVDGVVTKYDKLNQSPDMQWIDYGLGALTTQALELVDRTQRDLAQLHHVLAERGLLHGFQAVNRFYEIGTRQGMRETDRFLRQGH